MAEITPLELGKKLKSGEKDKLYYKIGRAHV